jgi:hypothetical protein
MKKALYSQKPVLALVAILTIAIVTVKAPCAVPNTSLQRCQWEQTTFAGNKLVKIGNHRLTSPIVFPVELKPLKNNALVTSSEVKHPKRFYFTLFYPISRKNRLIQWLKDFPKDVEANKSDIQVISKPKYFQSGKTWSYSIDAKTPKSYLRLRTIPFRQPLAEYNEYAINNPDMQEYLRAMSANGSPLIHEQEFVALTVIFDPIPKK